MASVARIEPGILSQPLSAVHTNMEDFDQTGQVRLNIPFLAWEKVGDYI